MSAGSPADRVARVALGRLGEPGDPRLARLVAELGAVRVHDALLAEEDLTGVGTDVALRLRGLDPEADLARAADGGIRFVAPDDPEWPAGLTALDRIPGLHGRGGAPLGLWVRGPGRLDVLTARAVAVVGSRSATTYGAAVAGDLASGVASQGVCVVSGAAYGIDQAAHRGALATRGPTVAVLACGADRAYPAGHRALLDYVAETGAVVSELPPGCSPTRLRFLSRNRLIAALSLGTVVVEAAARSGALNTASWAEQLGRPLMGVPGPVTSAPSEGVHELIRSRGAVLVTRAGDVLEVLAPAGEALATVPRGPGRSRDRLSLGDQQVLDAVPVSRPAGADSIARTAGVGVRQVREVLARLVSAGLVAGGSRDTWRLSAEARSDA